MLWQDLSNHGGGRGGTHDAADPFDIDARAIEQAMQRGKCSAAYHCYQEHGAYPGALLAAASALGAGGASGAA